MDIFSNKNTLYTDKVNNAIGGIPLSIEDAGFAIEPYSENIPQNLKSASISLTDPASQTLGSEEKIIENGDYEIVMLTTGSTYKLNDLGDDNIPGSTLNPFDQNILDGLNDFQNQADDIENSLLTSDWFGYDANGLAYFLPGILEQREALDRLYKLMLCLLIISDARSNIQDMYLQFLWDMSFTFTKLNMLKMLQKKYGLVMKRMSEKLTATLDYIQTQNDAWLKTKLEEALEHAKDEEKDGDHHTFFGQLWHDFIRFFQNLLPGAKDNKIQEIYTEAKMELEKLKEAADAITMNVILAFVDFLVKKYEGQDDDPFAKKEAEVLRSLTYEKLSQNVGDNGFGDNYQDLNKDLVIAIMKAIQALDNLRAAFYAIKMAKRKMEAAMAEQTMGVRINSDKWGVIENIITSMSQFVSAVISTATSSINTVMSDKNEYAEARYEHEKYSMLVNGANWITGITLFLSAGDLLGTLITELIFGSTFQSINNYHVLNHLDKHHKNQHTPTTVDMNEVSNIMSGWGISGASDYTGIFGNMEKEEDELLEQLVTSTCLLPQLDEYDGFEYLDFDKIDEILKKLEALASIRQLICMIEEARFITFANVAYRVTGSQVSGTGSLVTSAAKARTAIVNEISNLRIDTMNKEVQKVNEDRQHELDLEQAEAGIEGVLLGLVLDLAAIIILVVSVVLGVFSAGTATLIGVGVCLTLLALGESIKQKAFLDDHIPYEKPYEDDTFYADNNDNSVESQYEEAVDEIDSNDYITTGSTYHPSIRNGYGSWGDTKGQDLWAFDPAAVLEAQSRLLEIYIQETLLAIITAARENIADQYIQSIGGLGGGRTAQTLASGAGSRLNLYSMAMAFKTQMAAVNIEHHNAYVSTTEQIKDLEAQIIMSVITMAISILGTAVTALTTALSIVSIALSLVSALDNLLESYYTSDEDNIGKLKAQAKAIDEWCDEELKKLDKNNPLYQIMKDEIEAMRKVFSDKETMLVDIGKGFVAPNYVALAEAQRGIELVYRRLEMLCDIRDARNEIASEIAGTYVGDDLSSMTVQAGRTASKKKVQQVFQFWVDYASRLNDIEKAKEQIVMAWVQIVFAVLEAIATLNSKGDPEAGIKPGLLGGKLDGIDLFGKLENVINKAVGKIGISNARLDYIVKVMIYKIIMAYLPTLVEQLVKSILDICGPNLQEYGHKGKWEKLDRAEMKPEGASQADTGSAIGDNMNRLDALTYGAELDSAVTDITSFQYNLQETLRQQIEEQLYGLLRDALKQGLLDGIFGQIPGDSVSSLQTDEEKEAIEKLKGQIEKIPDNKVRSAAEKMLADIDFDSKTAIDELGALKVYINAQDNGIPDDMIKQINSYIDVAVKAIKTKEEAFDNLNKMIEKSKELGTRKGYAFHDGSSDPDHKGRSHVRVSNDPKIYTHTHSPSQKFIAGSHTEIYYNNISKPAKDFALILAKESDETAKMVLAFGQLITEENYFNNVLSQYAAEIKTNVESVRKNVQGVLEKVVEEERDFRSRTEGVQKLEVKQAAKETQQSNRIELSTVDRFQDVLFFQGMAIKPPTADVFRCLRPSVDEFYQWSEKAFAQKDIVQIEYDTEKYNINSIAKNDANLIKTAIGIRNNLSVAEIGSVKTTQVTNAIKGIKDQLALFAEKITVQMPAGEVKDCKALIQQVKTMDLSKPSQVVSAVSSISELVTASNVSSAVKAILKEVMDESVKLATTAKNDIQAYTAAETAVEKVLENGRTKAISNVVAGLSGNPEEIINNIPAALFSQIQNLDASAINKVAKTALVLSDARSETSNENVNKAIDGAIKTLTGAIQNSNIMTPENHLSASLASVESTVNIFNAVKTQTANNTTSGTMDKPNEIIKTLTKQIISMAVDNVASVEETAKFINIISPEIFVQAADNMNQEVVAKIITSLDPEAQKEVIKTAKETKQIQKAVETAEDITRQIIPAAVAVQAAVSQQPVASLPAGKAGSQSPVAAQNVAQTAKAEVTFTPAEALEIENEVSTTNTNKASKEEKNIIKTAIELKTKSVSAEKVSSKAQSPDVQLKAAQKVTQQLATQITNALPQAEQAKAKEIVAEIKKTDFTKTEEAVKVMKEVKDLVKSTRLPEKLQKIVADKINQAMDAVNSTEVNVKVKEIAVKAAAKITSNAQAEEVAQVIMSKPNIADKVIRMLPIVIEQDKKIKAEHIDKAIEVLDIVAAQNFARTKNVKVQAAAEKAKEKIQEASSKQVAAQNIAQTQFIPTVTQEVKEVVIQQVADGSQQPAESSMQEAASNKQQVVSSKVKKAVETAEDITRQIIPAAVAVQAAVSQQPVASLPAGKAGSQSPVAAQNIAQTVKAEVTFTPEEALEIENEVSTTNTNKASKEEKNIIKTAIELKTKSVSAEKASSKAQSPDVHLVAAQNIAQQLAIKIVNALPQAEQAKAKEIILQIKSTDFTKTEEAVKVMKEVKDLVKSTKLPEKLQKIVADKINQAMDAVNSTEVNVKVKEIAVKAAAKIVSNAQAEEVAQVIVNKPNIADKVIRMLPIVIEQDKKIKAEHIDKAIEVLDIVAAQNFARTKDVKVQAAVEKAKKRIQEASSKQVAAQNIAQTVTVQKQSPASDSPRAPLSKDQMQEQVEKELVYLITKRPVKAKAIYKQIVSVLNEQLNNNNKDAIKEIVKVISDVNETVEKINNNENVIVNTAGTLNTAINILMQKLSTKQMTAVDVAEITDQIPAQIVLSAIKDAEPSLAAQIISNSQENKKKEIIKIAKEEKVAEKAIDIATQISAVAGAASQIPAVKNDPAIKTSSDQEVQRTTSVIPLIEETESKIFSSDEMSSIENEFTAAETGEISEQEKQILKTTIGLKNKALSAQETSNAGNDPSVQIKGVKKTAEALVLKLEDCLSEADKAASKDVIALIRTTDFSKIDEAVKAIKQIKELINSADLSGNMKKVLTEKIEQTLVSMENTGVALRAKETAQKAIIKILRGVEVNDIVRLLTTKQNITSDVIRMMAALIENDPRINKDGKLDKLVQAIKIIRQDIKDVKAGEVIDKALVKIQSMIDKSARLTDVNALSAPKEEVSKAIESPKNLNIEYTDANNIIRASVNEISNAVIASIIDNRMNPAQAASFLKNFDPEVIANVLSRLQVTDALDILAQMESIFGKEAVIKIFSDIDKKDLDKKIKDKIDQMADDIRREGIKEVSSIGSNFSGASDNGGFNGNNGNSGNNTYIEDMNQEILGSHFFKTGSLL